MKKFLLASALALTAFTADALFATPAAQAAGNKAGKKNKKTNKAANKLEVLFKKLDTNGDGKLSKDEFAKINDDKKKNKKAAADVQFVAAKGKKKKGNKTDALFTKLDTNNDGFLSLDEFKKLTEIKAAQKKAKKAK
jgi:Ca2+-binding EF-hand superfamily protein